MLAGCKKGLSMAANPLQTALVAILAVSVSGPAVGQGFGLPEDDIPPSQGDSNVVDVPTDQVREGARYIYEAFKQIPVDKLEYDFSSGEAPLFSALGLTPSRIIGTSTGKQIDISNLSGQGDDAVFREGVGIDVGLRYLFGTGTLSDTWDDTPVDQVLSQGNIGSIQGGQEIVLDRDNSPGWDHGGYWDRRLLDRTKVSFGAIRGVEEANDALTVGASMTSTILTNQDVRADRAFLSCVLSDGNLKPVIQMFDAYKQSVGGAVAQGRRSGDAEMAAATALHEKAVSQLRARNPVGTVRRQDVYARMAGLSLLDSGAIDDCRKQASITGAKGWYWDVGVSSQFTTPNEENGFDDLKYAGAIFHTSFAFNAVGNDEDAADAATAKRTAESGFFDSDTIVESVIDPRLEFTARYAMDDKGNVEGSDTQFGRDVFSASGKLQFGGSIFNIFAESSYVHEDRKDGQDDQEFLQYTGGIEFRVIDDVFIQLSIGTTDGKEKDDTFGKGSFKVKFNPGFSNVFGGDN